MLIEIVVTSLFLSLIIAIRYLAIAGAGYAMFIRAASALDGPGRIRSRPTAPVNGSVRREIGLSLVSSPIYAVPAALALVAYKHGFGRLYLDPKAFGLLWLPASAAIYIFAQDAYYYWLHRALHQPAVFALAHRGHHLSRAPTPFASFAFDPLEAALTSWFLPALTFFVPLNLWVALALLTLMTLAAVLNHAGVEIWPRRWLTGIPGRYAITASHHDLHHRRQACNFGLYFRLWDFLMKTDREEWPPGRPAGGGGSIAAGPAD